MATTTTKTNKPILPRGVDNRPVDSYNRAELYSGKALDFDGVNDYVEVGSITDTYKSFCLYFKPDADIRSGTSYQRLFGIYEQYFGVSTGSATGITTGETLIFMPTGGGRFGTTMEFVADTWYHVAVVAKESDNTYLMYINAQDKTDLVVGTHTPAAATKIRLAWDAQGTGAKFDGQIANFKAFSEVLTAAQVADLYNNPEKVVPTGVDNTALKLWLPMQEGAGTTAYDGSGNGNHGTISGATYTHGIGAPVSQTAVIDWNKGTNLTLYSEDGSVWGTGGNAPTITQDQPDPFEGTRAQRIQMDKASNYAQIVKQHTQISASVQYTAKMWLKAVSGTPTIGINYNGSGGSWQNVTLTNEWAEYEVTRTMNADYEYSHNILIGNPAPGTSSTADFYIYGLQIQLGDTAGPYVPTFGTAQTSEVLLPQGLTTGRDITGVNLFENVRKQGALNLDGNSWAEVHDNESLDFGTGSFSLEAWAKVKFVDQGSSVNVILNLGNEINSADSAGLAMSNVLAANFWYSSPSGSSVLTQGDWVHIIGVYDETNATLYVNGSQVDQDARGAKDVNNALVKQIGRDVGPNRFYHDQIAQPRIYNRALTAEEVQRNYNAGKNIYTN